MCNRVAGQFLPACAAQSCLNKTEPLLAVDRHHLNAMTASPVTNQLLYRTPINAKIQENDIGDTTDAPRHECWINSICKVCNRACKFIGEKLLCWNRPANNSKINDSEASRNTFLRLTGH